MRTKQLLLNLVLRAEEGRLLPGEAQMLREAIEALADMTDTVNRMCDTGTGAMRVITDFRA